MPMLLSSDDLDEMLTRIHSSAAAGSLESQTLDFKQTPPNRMEAVKTLVEASICFANGHSGTVVVAVADATGGPGSFTGCDLDPATVQRRIYELTEPHLMAGVRAIERFGASHRSGTTCRFRSRWCSARRSSTARGIAFCRSDYGWVRRSYGTGADPRHGWPESDKRQRSGASCCLRKPSIGCPRVGRPAQSQWSIVVLSVRDPETVLKLIQTAM